MNPRLFIASVFLLLRAEGAVATPLAPLASPADQCRLAIQAAEKARGIPDQLLAAIAHVESGRRDPATGTIKPWPWTINVEGQGYVYNTKAEAIAAVQQMQAAGKRSIDVGCMQVNLMHHPDAFASLDLAFDPLTNAQYAARFLTQLFAGTADWSRAAAAYHSATPELGADYQRKVLAVWPDERRAAGNPVVGSLGPVGGTAAATSTQQASLATAWAATLPAGATQARVAVMLPTSTTQQARVFSLTPIAGGQPVAGVVGRPLASYQANPIPLAAGFRRQGG
jgi:hypothetical protein